jgi:hypothetical protein
LGDEPVDAVTYAIKDGKERFGAADGEKSEHEMADPRLMLGFHVIATHDEDCCDGDADGWKKPQCAQPPFFCPLAYVHEINVHVREDEQCDDECEYS